MNALANRPNYINDQRDINAALAGGLMSAQPPRISLNDDRFTLLSETGERHPTFAPALTIDVVIVGANDHVSRVYFDEYEQDASTPPICFSDNGVAPSTEALQPQNATCSGCPKAAWTKINALGNQVPWCQSRKKLAVLVAGAGETVYLLSVPPKSLKDAKDDKGMTLQPYMKHLAEHRAPAQGVVTRLSIESKILRFKDTGWVPKTSMDFVRGVVEGDLPANTVNAFDKPIENFAAIAGPRAVAAALPGDLAWAAQGPAAQGQAPVIRPAPPLPTYGATTTPAPMPFGGAETPPARISFTTSSTPAPEPPKRGRPRAQQPVDPPPPVEDGQPGQSFGMVSEPLAPPTDIQAKLDNVFARFGPK